MNDNQFQSELFQNYEAEAGRRHLPKLKRSEVVAHYKQMHGFLEEPYIFGDISNGDRAECWEKWCKKLAKDGVDNPSQFARGFFHAVDATAAYT